MAKTKSPLRWFADRTSMHGIPSLVKAKTTVGKLFWSLVCLFGLGMFIFMLSSLIIKYLSYPVIVRVEEIPKGMVHPKITFCNKRYMGILAELSLTNISTAEPSVNKKATTDFLKLLLYRVNQKNLSQSYKYAADDFQQLMNSLGKLKESLVVQVNLSRNSGLSRTQMETFNRWQTVADDLTDPWLVSTLLLNASGSQIFRLGVFQQYLDMSFVHCHRGKSECDRNYMSSFLSVTFSGCHIYNPLEGRELIESRVQGIRNGITFTFMTGSKLIASQMDINRSATLSALSDPFDTLTGTDGMRLIIHGPNESFWPEHEGMDISPGFSTIIGVTAKESRRLSSPYSECTNHNIEIDLLLKSIQQKLGYVPRRNEGLYESAYSTLECRSSCLQRYIWETCGCLLMGEYLPFFNSSLLCGHLGKAIENLHNPSHFEKEHCFTFEGMLTEECEVFLEKMFSDLKCLQNILGERSGSIEEKTSELKCHCPVPCQRQDYELTFSQSKWPSPGVELNAAYKTLVQDFTIPQFQAMNVSIVEGPINYLSNEDKKEEIMENFARVTVYVKSLKVERIEQVAAYTLLDLFSDVGGQLGLWVGISAITMFELLGFLSLLLQTLFTAARRAGELHPV